MDKTHYRFLIIEQGIIPAIANFIINGALAYAVFYSTEKIPLWGMLSVGGDTISTTFCLTSIITFLGTSVTYKKLRSGHLIPTAWRRASSILGKLPDKTIPRSIVLGLIYTAVLAPIAIAILTALNINEMPLQSFLIYKASYAAFVAALIAPVAALCVLGDA